ncbi:MAG TPA: PAS domain-containing protein [Bacteroidia bacterium]|nr:PAS domain-containing protein [Bacteroidia bacterium]
MYDLTVADLDTAPCGFFTFTDNGLIKAINSTLVNWLGYSDKSEVIGNSLESILTVAGRIFYNTHFFPLVKMHGRANEIFFILKKKMAPQFL